MLAAAAVVVRPAAVAEGTEWARVVDTSEAESERGEGRRRAEGCSEESDPLPPPPPGNLSRLYALRSPRMEDSGIIVVNRSCICHTSRTKR